MPVHPPMIRLWRAVGLPQKWLDEFQGAHVRKVEVNLRQRTWNIHLCFPSLVSCNQWLAIQQAVQRAFQETCSVWVQFHYQQNLDPEQVIRDYWGWIRSQFPEKEKTVLDLLEEAEWKKKGRELAICLPNDIVCQFAKKKEADQFIMRCYQQITGQLIHVKLLSVSKEDRRQALKEQIKREDQNQIQQALSARTTSSASSPSDKATVDRKQIGAAINDQPVKISQIQDEERRVTVEGKVFKKEIRELKSGRQLLLLYLTDYTNSIAVKYFLREKEDKEFVNRINKGTWLRVRGSVRHDSFLRELVLNAEDMHEVPPKKRMDTAEEKRVELHLHTQMSDMDGICSLEEVVKRAKEWGHTAVAITDHGVVQAFPEAYDIGKKYGVKVILGVEAYMVDDGVPVVIRADDRNLQDAEYVVFDIETTGLSVVHDVIIELAAVKLKNGEIIDRFSTFVNPHRRLPAHIVELTKITDDMLENAPEIEDVIADFQKFIEGCILVAHNASFDVGFLQEALKRTGREPANNPVLDTLELARYLYPDLKNHRLNTLCKHLSVNLEQHHRAIHDAEATGHVLWKMIEKCKVENLETLSDLNNLMKNRDLRRLRPFHVVILVQNKMGLKNLYKLISKSHLETFHRVPRIPRSEFIKHREGLVIGSGCEKGELYEAVLNKSTTEVEELARFYDFLEIQPLDFYRHLIEKKLVENEERLKEAHRLLVEIGEKLDKPVVATGNVHYLDPEDHIFREIIVFNRPGAKENYFPKAHFRTTDEMLKEFSFLGEEKAYKVVVTNSRKIAEQLEELSPFPDGTFTPTIEGAEEELRTICYRTAHEWYGDPLPPLVRERLDTELNAIINNGFAVIYLIAHKLVTKSLKDGYLVGSRGSVGSSFAATMSHVTEVNPLPPHYRCPSCKWSEFVTDGSVESGFDLPDKDCPSCGTPLKKDGHDIPFATFLGFEGDKTPDIDLNFASDYQARCHAYAEELFGRDYIFRAGSIGTVKEKTAYGFVKKYMEEKQIHLRGAEIERLVQGCLGVKRSTGQHPGGLMVIPQHMDVHDFTPIQKPANNENTSVITTHFDYDAISGRILKLDLLGHKVPAMLRMLQDMTGIAPQTIPPNDPKVMELFRSTKSLGIEPEDICGIAHGTLGIPEFNTVFARGILADTRPTRISELTRISGLSHGTDVWAGNARELIRNGVCTLSEAICNRDDIMLYLIRQGLPPKQAFQIMERVRKGKGLTDDQIQAMKENGVPDWYIESCNKIKYMFPRAHAAAYVISAIWIAYFKVYHPLEFYAAHFTTHVKHCDIALMIQGYDAVRKKVESLYVRGSQLSTKEEDLLSVLEVALEMYARGYSFLPVDLYESHAYKFQVKDGKLLPPFASVVGIGESAANNLMKAREEAEFLSIEDLKNRSGVSTKVVEVLEQMGCLKGLAESNQLSLFESLG